MLPSRKRSKLQSTRESFSFVYAHHAACVELRRSTTNWPWKRLAQTNKRLFRYSLSAPQLIQPFRMSTRVLQFTRRLHYSLLARKERATQSHWCHCGVRVARARVSTAAAILPSWGLDDNSSSLHNRRRAILPARRLRNINCDGAQSSLLHRGTVASVLRGKSRWTFLRTGLTDIYDF